MRASLNFWTCVMVVSVGCASSQELPPCECVPYYQCRDTQIITDGTDLLLFKAVNRAGAGIRKRDCGGTMVCCNLPPGARQNATAEAATPDAAAPQTPFAANTDPKDDSQSAVPDIPEYVNIPRTSFCGVRRELPDQSGHITAVSTGATHYAEFPWTMMILIKKQDGNRVSYKLKCGGSLVHPEVVVTAAQCVQGIDIKKLKIRGGEWDQANENEPLPHQDRSAYQIIVHPDFNQANGQNDIAVILLHSPFNKADNVDIICLPHHSQNFDRQRCIVAGWGKDNFNDTAFKQVLRKVDTSVLPADDCQTQLRKTRLGRYFVLDKSFICTEGGEPGKDTCLGDGGAPLVCPQEQDPKRWAQVGIVSWGIDCGDRNPAVYTRLSNYINWIIEQVPFNDTQEAPYIPEKADFI